MSLGILEYLGIGLLLVGFWAIIIEPWLIKVTRCEVKIPDLPPAWDGLRLGFIADTHSGGWAPRAFFERAWKILRLENPQALLIGGDIVVSHATPIWQEHLSGLQDLQPELGKFAVLGGHDRQYNPAEVSEGLTKMGVRVLHNDAIRLERQGQELFLVGLGDNSDLPHQSDLPAALAQVQGANASHMQGANASHMQGANTSPVPSAPCSILLAHSPDIALNPLAPRCALILSGHTHAGQVRIPYCGAILCVTDLPRRHDRGLSVVQGVPLFVTRGLGCTVRLRFCCPPEIAILTLKRPERPAQAGN